MPRRKSGYTNNGKIPASTEQYRKMYKDADLCKSQIFNEVYNKLKTERRLDRFIAVVQYCSMSGINIDETVEVLLKAFPGYLSPDKLTVSCLNDMITNYSDISIAWGYGSLGDEISQIIVKNKALKIVEKSDNMDDIAAYQSLFGKKIEESNNVDNKTTVNFNLFKKG